MAKITARFGADVSEVEQKMMQATRAANYYKKAVDSVDGKQLPDLTKRLNQSNEQLQKGMTLLRGGAVGAGLGLLLGQMRKFSQHAEEMGDKATEAQKSAALWGQELKGFTDTITGWGASALGTLASWGRGIGEFFRDPADKAYDAVAASSEEMAKRQEEALAKSKKAHADAAATIPALLGKLAKAQDEVELDKLGKVGRAMTEINRLEKERASLQQGPQNAVTRARQIEIEIELTKRKADLDKEYAATRAKEADDAAKQAQDKASAEAKAIAEKDSAAAKAADREKAAAAELAEMAYEKLTDEQKLAEVIKRGREASAKVGKSGLASDKLEVEKLRLEYEKLTAAIMAAKGQEGQGSDAKFEREGLKRGADGKLRRGNRILSEEDAKRVVSAREKAERETGKTGTKADKTETLLDKIEKHLRPETIK